MRLVLALLMVALPGLAFAEPRVTCDAKVKRIADNLRHEPMSPDQAERARQALYAAIDQCRPLSSGSAPHRTAEREPAPPPDTRIDRQSLRAQQNVLTPSEQREGERRLDAIDRKAATDPGVAREMQRIYQADQALSTNNRPIPGSPPGSSLVGPGDR